MSGGEVRGEGWGVRGAAAPAEAGACDERGDVVEAFGAAGSDGQEGTGIEVLPGLEDDLLFSFGGRRGDEDWPARREGGKPRGVRKGRRGGKVVLDVARDEDAPLRGAETRDPVRVFRGLHGKERDVLQDPAKPLAQKKIPAE